MAARQDFLANMSHELRAPLTSIREASPTCWPPRR
ncbi:histidine kinase dimerization/phospho-acceptor domain-containing protein [Caulobacter segnis]